MVQIAYAKNPFGKMSNTTAIFTVGLIGFVLYMWIFRPKRR